MVQQVVYGLDIETGHAGRAVDGTGRPIDPGEAPVTRAVLSTPARDRFFSGDEADLLDELDAALAELEPGILTTWNGSGFTLPYLADRATLCAVDLGLRLAADPRLRLRGEQLVGHTTGYRAAWYAHRHLDAARLYRSGRRPLVEVTTLLRALGRPGRARMDDVGPADVPGAELTHAATHAFAANDARLVRTMIENRLPGVVRHVDRITVPAPDAFGATVRNVRRRLEPATVRMSPAHPAVRAALLHDLATPGS